MLVVKARAPREAVAAWNPGADLGSVATRPFSSQLLRRPVSEQPESGSLGAPTRYWGKHIVMLKAVKISRFFPPLN